MPKGLVVPKTKVKRKRTPIEQAFAGMPTVTKFDIAELKAAGINTVGDFAEAVNDGDLTDVGATPESSIRLTAAFEASEYADLLDYEGGETEPTAAVATTTSTTPAGASPWERFKAGLRGKKI